MKFNKFICEVCLFGSKKEISSRHPHFFIAGISCNGRFVRNPWDRSSKEFRKWANWRASKKFAEVELHYFEAASAIWRHDLSVHQHHMFTDDTFERRIQLTNRIRSKSEFIVENDFDDAQNTAQHFETIRDSVIKFARTTRWLDLVEIDTVENGNLEEIDDNLFRFLPFVPTNCSHCGSRIRVIRENHRLLVSSHILSHRDLVSGTVICAASWQELTLADEEVLSSHLTLFRSQFQFTRTIVEKFLDDSEITEIVDRYRLDSTPFVRNAIKVSVPEEFLD